jgi:hypothetical protein
LLKRVDMKQPSRTGTGVLSRALRLSTAALAIAGAGAFSGCLTRPIESLVPLTTSVVVEKLTETGIDKIDIVLVVDNSASMADKQAILALAIPDLLKGLVNPQCLDNKTGAAVADQPASSTLPCPDGSTYEFPPVFDIHVGLLSSSLGSFGTSACVPATVCGQGITNDDHGHLVTRSDPCGQSAPVETYENLGFLAWDPEKQLTPPGETALGDPTVTPPVAGLTTSLHDLVVGDGQLGCGYESQNEAWYRFLVDPSPYQSISLVNNQVQTTGIDQDLLQQRKDFLRPDSLLAIINVTDETDTSLKEYSGYPVFSAGTPLPRPRSECAASATDPCCLSCEETAPASCPFDPVCTTNGKPGGPLAYTVIGTDDNLALRAFGLISHKQRYGIEFFYQPSRYVNALTSPTVADVNGKQVPNPIFSVLDPTQKNVSPRAKNLVFYAAITGVPWQLIARQKDGVPDLINGVSALDPTQVGGFKSAAELDLTDPEGNIFWDDIAGDPENYVEARSPYMVELGAGRSRKDPITGTTIAPSGTPNGSGPMVGGALINDHDRLITTGGDIQYACVFPILSPIDDSVSGGGDCAPGSGNMDNPLCAPNPADSGNYTLQTKAKAYPGLKHLAIARGMGSQGIAASICAKQLDDKSKADFGYRPAMKAIIDRLKLALHPACLPRTLSPDTSGEVQCLILEASTVPTAEASACNQCQTAGRQPISMSNPNHEPAVQAALQDPDAAMAGWNCFCEIPQTTLPAGSNPGLEDCQTNPNSTANGWCYVDPSTAPANYSPAEIKEEKDLVTKCPATEQHDIRFVGTGKAQEGATLFITCAGP